ncbi:MAG: cytochrome C [Saprospirales bacterium]|nr:MAG: cytochrome C [Saprospirales bacterium]
MKKLLKILLIIVAGLILTAGLGATYIRLALPNVGPPPEIEVDITPERVERGKYLAWNVMLCAECHGKRDFSILTAPTYPGSEFAGGEVFDHSVGLPGVFVAPNITPYGIGDWTDGELFRLITTGVKPDGNPVFPIMPYHNYRKLDPEDIKSVIAYLRTLEPIELDHPASKADFPVNFIMRTLPKPPELKPAPDRSDLIAYGKYLFDAAVCGDCHTKLEGGQFIDPIAGGGREFTLPDGSLVRSPNLTPHLTGLGKFSRESFIARFKMYADSSLVLPMVEPGDFQTIMPWKFYAGMTEEDLGAIYEYLNSLEPYDHAVETFVAFQ